MNFPLTLTRQIFQYMKKSLEKYCVNSGLFSDVTFELDDGHIKSHRAMLIARCDVMRAMLNGDFREAHTNVVSDESTVVEKFN